MPTDHSRISTDIDFEQEGFQTGTSRVPHSVDRCGQPEALIGGDRREISQVSQRNTDIKIVAGNRSFTIHYAHLCSINDERENPDRDRRHAKNPA